MQKIILASGSGVRKKIFSSLGLPFEVIAADIDEKAIRNNDLKKQAEMIARAKAEKVAADNDAVVISGDTFLEANGIVLEKPKDKDEAKKMLELQSGKEVRAYTGFCYLDKQNKIDYSIALEVFLKLRELSPQEIDEYVENAPATIWSAAFSPAYPYGAGLVAELRGSLTAALYGLPIEELVPQLRKSGFEIHPKDYI